MILGTDEAIGQEFTGVTDSFALPWLSASPVPSMLHLDVTCLQHGFILASLDLQLCISSSATSDCYIYKHHHPADGRMAGPVWHV